MIGDVSRLLTCGRIVPISNINEPFDKHGNGPQKADLQKVVVTIF
jgi:hypothetical protein